MLMGRAVLGEEFNPNVLGNVIVFGMLAGLYVFFSGRLVSKLLVLAAGVIMLIAVVMTQSRSAMGSLVLAPLSAFILCARKGQRLKYLGGVVLIFLVGYGMVQMALKTNMMTERGKQRMMQSRYDIRESGRLNMWYAGWEMIKERPVWGWGLKNFGPRFGLQHHIYSAHNNIIEFTAELGLIGALLAAIIHISLYKYVRKSPFPLLEWLAVTFLFYTFYCGLTHTLYFFKDFWYALGFAMLIGKLSHSYMEQTDYELLPLPMNHDGEYQATENKSIS